MYFIVHNHYKKDLEDRKDTIMQFALELASLYKITPAVEKLDKFIQQNYKHDLKTVCLWLIKHKTKIVADPVSDNFIISFVDSKSDNLAKLITYGNGEINGCNILKYAFNLKRYGGPWYGS